MGTSLHQNTVDCFKVRLGCVLSYRPAVLMLVCWPLAQSLLTAVKTFGLELDEKRELRLLSSAAWVVITVPCPQTARRRRGCSLIPRTSA